MRDGGLRRFAFCAAKRGKTRAHDRSRPGRAWRQTFRARRQVALPAHRGVVVVMRRAGTIRPQIVSRSVQMLREGARRVRIAPRTKCGLAENKQSPRPAPRPRSLQRSPRDRAARKRRVSAMAVCRRKKRSFGGTPRSKCTRATASIETPCSCAQLRWSEHFG